MNFRRQCHVCGKESNSSLKTVMCCNKPMLSPLKEKLTLEDFLQTSCGQTYAESLAEYEHYLKTGEYVLNYSDALGDSYD